jgi:hopanoid biosynthesis associated protein HpnK
LLKLRAFLMTAKQELRFTRFVFIHLDGEMPRSSLEGQRDYLIVTADDFGLAEEVNEAIEIAHRYGILSAASLMVAGPAAEDAVRRARRLPNLRLGLHLVLLEEKPVLPSREIPGLVDDTGRMRHDLVHFAFELARSKRLRAQMRKEIEAQFAAYLGTGLRLDHVNVHKHYHLHPVVGRSVIAMAHRFGARAMRVPLEPLGPIRHVDDKSISTGSLALACCARWLRSQVRHAGLLAPDAVFGLAWSGVFTSDRLVGLLRHLPRGLVEIYMHPATDHRFPGSAHGYRYPEELKALCATEALDEIRQAGLKPIGYSDVGC